MSELIDREALIKSIWLSDRTVDIFQKIEHAPAVDAVPVVHGRWILLGKNEHDYETSVEEKCSLCGRYVYRYDTELQDNYCPNSGARMDVKEDKQ